MHEIKLESYSDRIDNISCVCGHCGNKVSMDVTQEYKEKRKIQSPYGDEWEYFVLYQVGQCPECGRPLIYDVEKKMVIPYSCEFGQIAHVPDDINKLFEECKLSYSIGAYTCCVITARTILMHIAVNTGADINKNFTFYVDYLVNNFLPTQISKPWVDKIRKLGNESVHDLVIASKENANQSLTFLIQILKIIYELPNSI